MCIRDRLYVIIINMIIIIVIIVVNLVLYVVVEPKLGHLVRPVLDLPARLLGQLGEVELLELLRGRQDLGLERDRLAGRLQGSLSFYIHYH